MSHLSPEQLSAHADGALTGRALEQAVRHLDGCRACRDLLERVRHATEELGRALEHDPGEAYFAAFPERVLERIASAPAAQPLPEPPKRAAWWSSPSALAWVGGAAAVVVGGAVVLLVSNPNGVDLRRHLPAPAPPVALERAPVVAAPENLLRAAAPAAPGVAAHPSGPMPEALRPSAPAANVPAPAAKARPAPTGKAEASASRPRDDAAPTGRAYEVRQIAGDEVVPAHPQRWRPGRAPASPPPADVEGGGPVRVVKQRRAEPLAGQALEGRGGAARTEAESDVAAGRVRACGTVVDDKGRAVEGAQVVLADLGVAAVTDRAGRFCITAPGGTHTLGILAVGFQPLRRSVELGAAASELALALQPVAVLERPMALGSPGAPGGAGAPAARTNALAPSLGEAIAPAPADTGEAGLGLIAQLPDSVRSLARRAHRIALDAAAARSAAQYDGAAAAWEKVLRHAAGSAAELEVRHRLALARLHAWELAPSERRVLAAEEALTAYLVRAPAGRAREQAAVWLDQLRH